MRLSKEKKKLERCNTLSLLYMAYYAIDNFQIVIKILKTRILYR